MYLKIDERYTHDDMRRIKDKELLTLVNNNIGNIALVETSYSEFEIPKGYVFRNVVSTKSRIILPCSVELKYISVWAKSINEIPIGYKTISLIQFLDESSLNNFPHTDIFKDSYNHIYLTTLAEIPQEM